MENVEVFSFPGLNVLSSLTFKYEYVVICRVPGWELLLTLTTLTFGLSTNRANSSAFQRIHIHNFYCLPSSLQFYATKEL